MFLTCTRQYYKAPIGATVRVWRTRFTLQAFYPQNVVLGAIPFYSTLDELKKLVSRQSTVHIPLGTAKNTAHKRSLLNCYNLNCLISSQIDRISLVL